MDDENVKNLTDENPDILDWVSSLDGLCQSVSESSPGQQAIIGGVYGWTLGYLGLKVGKMVAFTVGCSLLIVQVATYNGLVKIRRKKNGHVKMTIKKVQKKEKVEIAYLPTPEQAQQFVENNGHFLGGFTTGLMFGISSG